jgi:hypothetical protein
MAWLGQVAAIASLISEILKLFKKKHTASIVQDLKNAKTKEEKQAAGNRLSAELYNG